MVLIWIFRILNTFYQKIYVECLKKLNSYYQKIVEGNFLKYSQIGSIWIITTGKFVGEDFL